MRVLGPAAVDAAALLPGDLVRLVEPDGSHDEAAVAALGLDPVELRAMYRHMAVTRRIDREAVALQRQGKLATYSPCTGQEAAQVGSVAAIGSDDWVFPAYREMGAAVARGLDPVCLLTRSSGLWHGGHAPHEARFALACVPIGTQTLHATGWAMGAKLDGSAAVALCYLGDGATSEGDTHEGWNFAAVYGAPVIFVIQNNGWAISVPVTRQTRAPSLAHKAIGYGMPGVRVDGNDALAVLAVTREAVARARRGDGPTIVEAMTYRMGGHTTADDPTRYQDPAELERWAARDPIARMEAFLRRAGMWDDEFASWAAAEADRAAAHVRGTLFDAVHGDPEELFEHVYVSPPPILDRHRALMRDERRRHDR